MAVPYERQRARSADVPVPAAPTAHGAARASPAQLRSLEGEGSAGFSTTSNSWSSAPGFASIGATANGISRPLAWASVRHQVLDDDKVEVDDKGNAVGGCSQTVLATCLHLSHEMALRDVGQYAWTVPNPKDARGSTVKIMKEYMRLCKEMVPQADLEIRPCPDPSKASIQQNLQTARLAAGPDSYVSFLYLGHGIQEPPTEAGELWCYDRSFEECAVGGGPSEYIPILLFDLLTWAGASSCYVWDCPHAGRFIRAALIEAEEIDSQLRAAGVQNPTVGEVHPAVYVKRQIHFAACGADQVLPRVSGLPDDIFTACLMTPLRMAILYHNLRTFPLTSSAGAAEKYSPRSPAYMASLWGNMPAELQARLWFELSAILHTIAWQTLDGRDYQKLFSWSGDMISNLACGFLVAQRVMATYHANPESIPAIPDCTSHALWTTWELIMDNFFEQLPMWFDDNTDSAWADTLSLVSFMEDQLDSILSSTGGLADFNQPYPSLSKLPIICQAALTEQFRLRAATALDASLRGLDIRGLTRAIQGGALDTAAHLLELDDPSISKQMISIWASLVRHDSAVHRIAKEGKTAARLTSVPCVRFFLDSLDRHVNNADEESITTIIQTAAVLSTIANFVAGRKAPLFAQRTLKMSSIMMGRNEPLVQQWGALLLAEVMASIDIDQKTEVHLDLESIRQQLFGLIASRTVEVRATAVYALTRFVDTNPVDDIIELAPILEVTDKFFKPPRTIGSPLVRKELVRLWHRVLRAGGKWTSVTMIIYMMQLAIESLPHRKEECERFSKEFGTQINLSKEQQGLLLRVNNIVKSMHIMLHDPNAQVSSMVAANFKQATTDLRVLIRQSHWTEVFDAAFPVTRGEKLWTDETLEYLKRLKERLVESWDKPRTVQMDIPGRSEWNNDLFEKTKMSLHAYLASQTTNTTEEEETVTPIVRSSERTWILRHRMLEDSLVVAEQQVGLPWKWAMKEITAPDPWSFVCYHSFNSTVLSCNEQPTVMLWDWASARKTGQVRLKAPPKSKITSARFVNELHEQMVVLAEMNTGDIHVLAGPSHEPSQMQTISSFLALDVNRTSPNFSLSAHRHLRTSWWRQSGKLCVAGASEMINVWDCSAERCERTFLTNATVACKTLCVEPVSGNLVFGGFGDGKVRLFDLRQSRMTPLLEYDGDYSSDKRARSGQRIYKIGIKLGESKHLTTAGENGMLNIHDLRNLSMPTSSILSQPGGMAWASYQAHSGLMATVSTLNPAPLGKDVNSHSHAQHGSRPRVNFGLYRSTLSSLSSVTEDVVTFDRQQDDVVKLGQAPYAIIHPLRPFVGIGYGRSCLLRGSGVGKGDDTDSGSYSFLKAQARFVTE